MPRLAILTGVALILLALVFFFLQDADSRSATALIPAFIGIPIAAGGLVALAPTRVKAGMHIAVGFAVLGVLGSLFGRGGFAIPSWIAAFTGQSDSTAPWLQMIMFVICGLFVARSFKWFADNRKNRAEA